MGMVAKEQLGQGSREECEDFSFSITEYRSNNLHFQGRASFHSMNFY